MSLILATLLMLFTPGNRSPSTPPPAMADRIALEQWWEGYQRSFMEADGRVVRPRDGRDTVSEGQAYALIFAVALDDRPAFDRVHAWTQANLSRRDAKGDRLLAWHWKDGKVADWNSAADADVDYAFALLLAHRRWGGPALLDEAKTVARDIMQMQTAVVERFGLVLLPGSWAENGASGTLINPSYFSPAAFRLFHQTTGDKRWKELAENSYRVWERSGERLGKQKGAGLPPDWCLARPGGLFDAAPERSSSYGWEALRLPMRAGLDAMLLDQRAARRYLRGPTQFFLAWFFRHASVASVYTLTGEAEDPAPSLAMTAMALFAFQSSGGVAPDSLARSADALSRSFDALRALPQAKDDYYGQSLSFFPLAARARALGFGGR